ncbi:MAG: hypothetical protein K0R50_4502, partial [Eubacterium sp.]|nr:hypothetical protein [Eubacterium sp.]
MKQKLSAILLALLFLFTNYSFKVSANEVQLLPAVIETINGEKWGYIDESGAFKINPQYSFVGEFNDKGIAIAANGNKDHNNYKVCFIDMSGKIISGPFSSYIPEFENGAAILNTDNNGSIVVGEDGRVLFKSSYRLDEYNDGMISFLDSKSELYGFLDLSGKVVIPAKYVSVQAFEKGNAIVEVSKEKFSVIDKSGKVLKLLKAYNKYNSSEGKTAYYDEQQKAYGYKQLDGTISIKPSFSSAAPFFDGFAVVAVSGENGLKFGLID